MTRTNGTEVDLAPRRMEAAADANGYGSEHDDAKVHGLDHLDDTGLP